MTFPSCFSFITMYMYTINLLLNFIQTCSIPEQYCLLSVLHAFGDLLNDFGYFIVQFGDRKIKYILVIFKMVGDF
jgi:hypothetical protein